MNVSYNTPMPNEPFILGTFYSCPTRVLGAMAIAKEVHKYFDIKVDSDILPMTLKAKGKPTLVEEAICLSDRWRWHAFCIVFMCHVSPLGIQAALGFWWKLQQKWPKQIDRR